MGPKILTKVPAALVLLIATLVVLLGGYFGDYDNHGFRDEQLTKRGHSKLVTVHQHRFSNSHQRFQKDGDGDGAVPSQNIVKIAVSPTSTANTNIARSSHRQHAVVSKRWLLFRSLLI